MFGHSTPTDTKDTTDREESDSIHVTWCCTGLSQLCSRLVQSTMHVSLVGSWVCHVTTMMKLLMLLICCSVSSMASVGRWKPLSTEMSRLHWHAATALQSVLLHSYLSSPVIYCHMLLCDDFVGASVSPSRRHLIYDDSRDDYHNC